jgi:flavin prenyltransferase
MRLIVGMTGATGAVFGVRILENLRELPDVETHLVLSRWARTTIELETGLSVAEVSALADVSHKPEDQGATISSGSFKTDGMVIVPCSMKTLAGVAHGLSRNLIERAADVMLKERRPLIIVPRETPMSLPQLKNMVLCAEAGAMVMPAMPAFYQKPETLEHLADFMAGKILSALGFAHDLYPSWKSGSAPDA